MYDLVKFTSLIVYPLGAALLMMAAALIFAGFGLGRVAAALGGLAFIWLWVWSMPVIAAALRSGLEGHYAHVKAEDAPEADAIVVLGGAFSFDADSPYPDAGASVDRYWHGARLYHAGKAARIILTGGRDPAEPDRPTEAQSGALFLRDMGVPEGALLLDNKSRTTADHVRYISEIMADEGLSRLLLVTSATHMRRSEAVFRRAGLDITPVATDFSVGPGAGAGVRRWLPSVNALSGSTSALHEYYGYWFYRLQGWI